MVKFDFITDEQFRHVLESDAQELHAAFNAKAWKAVHVLAGSILEAVLLDYLQSLNYQPAQNGKPLLHYDLAQLIDACVAENVLTERHKQLALAIKGFRNLIHAG